MTNLEILSNRAVFEIEGEDRKKFLQGLITNDVNKASEQNLIYAVMLSAQGRFLYDFFIFEISDKLIVDCDETKRDEIIKKLNFYKLRSQVVIKKNDELKVFYNQNGQGLKDPRHEKLGFRFYGVTQDSADYAQKSEYDFTRISLKIPEGESDLTHDKSFILEFGFDDFHAIDYQKGCYVGQELTARTHYRGEIRKKVLYVKILTQELPVKNSEITCEGKSAGIILSSVFHENEIHALALIKDSQEISCDNLDISGHKILVIN